MLEVWKRAGRWACAVLLVAGTARADPKPAAPRHTHTSEFSVTAGAAEALCDMNCAEAQPGFDVSADWYSELDRHFALGFRIGYALFTYVPLGFGERDTGSSKFGLMMFRVRAVNASWFHAYLDSGLGFTFDETAFPYGNGETALRGAAFFGIGAGFAIQPWLRVGPAVGVLLTTANHQVVGTTFDFTGAPGFTGEVPAHVGYLDANIVFTTIFGAKH